MQLTKTKKYTMLFGVVLATCLAVSLGHNGVVRAHEADEGPYEATVAPGDSMTTLTRRALLAYDQEHNDVTLSPATLIYCETKIVRGLGARLLEVGEQFTLPVATIQDYVTRSKNLSATQVAAWQTYAERVDFSKLQPLPHKTTATKQESAEQDESQASANKKDSPGLLTATVLSQRQDFEWYWWVMAIVAVVALYALQTAAPTPPPPSRRRGRKGRR
jgi:hypothetical protein